MDPGYRLVAAIHENDHSEVWKAEDSSRRQVAIKFKRRTDDDTSVSCELEGLRLVRHLQHPHLLQLRTYGIDDHEFFLVTDLADGNLLDRVLQSRERRSAIAVHELLTFIRGAAEGIDCLHSNDLIHSCISPHHILVFREKAKIASFTLTHRSGGPPPLALRTYPKSAATPPEFHQGQPSIHSDQYSLAYTYACLRLSERGFPLKFDQPLPSLVGMPEAKVLRKALAREPNQRFGTCVEFAAALESSVLDPPGWPEGQGT